MKQRGRRPRASLTVVGADTPAVQALERPEPPHDLTDEQAEEWRAVVDRLPADWFPRETHALLTMFCRHVVAGRRVAELILQLESAAPDDFVIEDYDRLLKMQEREGRAASALAMRMRLTQQATFTAKRSKPAGTTRAKPWKFDVGAPREPSS